jgi:hypothetical protein
VALLQAVLSSDPRSYNFAKDPEGVLLWRQLNDALRVDRASHTQRAG